jgi:hypothetical protein
MPAGTKNAFQLEMRTVPPRILQCPRRAMVENGMVRECEDEDGGKACGGKREASPLANEPKERSSRLLDLRVLGRLMQAFLSGNGPMGSVPFV